MPRNKKKSPQNVVQERLKTTKTDKLKKSLGYWLTLVFAVLAALSLIISLILPALL